MKKIMLGILAHAFVSDKHCNIGEYLKSCECLMNHIDDLVVTFDEIKYTLKSESTNRSGRKNYLLIAVVLLAIAFLLLLVAIVIKHFMRHGLKIPCLISY